jgi:hypothetical protein
MRRGREVVESRCEAVCTRGADEEAVVFGCKLVYSNEALRPPPDWGWPRMVYRRHACPPAGGVTPEHRTMMARPSSGAL